MLEFFPMVQKEGQQPEIVLNVEQVKAMKLRMATLPEHLPDQHETIYNFATFLADRFQEHSLAPIGFLIGTELALHDLEAGVDGFSGEPISNKYKIANQATAVYRLLRLSIADIADATTTPEFASQVKEVKESIETKQINVYGEEGQPEFNIPGRDLYEMIERKGLLRSETLPPRGIILQANFALNGNGVFAVLPYDNNIERVELSEQGNDGEYKYLYASFGSREDYLVRQLHLGYEHPGYLGKEREPFNRGETVSYVPAGFDRLDAISLPSGRLLIDKKMSGFGGLSTRIDQHPWHKSLEGKVRQVARWFEHEDYKGVGEAIKVLARDFMRVEPNSATIVGKEVEARLSSNLSPDQK